MSPKYSYSGVAKLIDHSLLNPMLKWNDLQDGIALALAYDVASVCIMPYALKYCAERLHGSNMRASSTLGFPHDCHNTATKVAEARQALVLVDGGEELDMVVNISKVLSGDCVYVKHDLREVEETHATGRKVKVIFENAYLTMNRRSDCARSAGSYALGRHATASMMDEARCLALPAIDF